MGKKDINLIKKRGRRLGLRGKIRLINLAGVFSLLVYFSVLLTLFFYSNMIKKQEANLLAIKESREKKIKDLVQIESLQQDVKVRLSALTEVFPQQVDLKEILDYFEGILPEGLRFDSISLSEEGDVSLNVKTQDSLVLEEIEKKIFSQEAGGELESAKLTSISRDEEGGYNISLSFKLKSLGFNDL